jgi:hypothetical protein
LVNNDKNNLDKKKYNVLISNINILYFAIYVIANLLILRKNINISDYIFNLKNDEKKIFDTDIFIIYQFIIDVVDFLNYDIIRTKIFFYSTTPKELVNKFITIIDDFNIQEIINNIE